MTALRVVLRAAALAWLAAGIGAGMVGVMVVLRDSVLSDEAVVALAVGLACTLAGTLPAAVERLSDWGEGEERE